MTRTVPPRTTVGPTAAGALVFGSSAAVLVVELVALRLLAPYLGLTLETNTLVIGIALTAIATGAWTGGRAADRVAPRRVLGPLLAVSGGAVAVSPFLVRGAGATGDGGLILLAGALAVFVPGALLSAVTPMVTKLRLTSLDETGTVVGRLSGIGTTGAIVGTVLTGFVLVSAVPVTGILVGLGAALVLASVAVEVAARRWRAVAPPAALVLLGSLGVALAPSSCDAETTYHCAAVDPDPDNADASVLVLDGIRNSTVDPGDPTYLAFEYVASIASFVDTRFPPGEPLRTYHLGGGGVTLPRYLDEVRPGTTSLVSEIDPGVIEVDRERLGLRTGDGIDVRVEDGRLGLRRLADDRYDLVVGDAFGGVSVPWHLTTREAMTEVRRVLTPGGSYVANLIDHQPLGFARAEVATLAAVFDHVALSAEPEAFTGEGGGNLVVAASDEPLDTAAWQARLDERDTPWATLSGADLDAWLGDAQVLTDEHAPVDQLLTPFG